MYHYEDQLVAPPACDSAAELAVFRKITQPVSLSSILHLTNRKHGCSLKKGERRMFDYRGVILTFTH